VNSAVDTATRAYSWRKDSELLYSMQMVREEKVAAIDEIRSRTQKNEAQALAKFRVENSAIKASAAVDAVELAAAKKQLQAAEISRVDLAKETKAAKETASKEKAKLEAQLASSETADVSSLREDFKKQLKELENAASLELEAVAETAAAASAALEQALEAAASVSAAQQSLFEATAVAATAAAEDDALEIEALQAAALQLAEMARTLEFKVNDLEKAAQKAEAERLALEAERDALRSGQTELREAAEAADAAAADLAAALVESQAETAALKEEILEMDNGFEESTTLLKQQFDQQLQRKIQDLSGRGDARA
jgi:chromosome segregation ATPase